MHLKVEDFELYAQGQLPHPRAVDIELHVARCPDCDAKLKDAMRIAGASRRERRQHSRKPADQTGWMQVVHPPRHGAWEVRVVDSSAEGMSIQTRQHMTRGWKIKVRQGDRIVFGEVRYCIPHGGEFRAGIQIREVL
ncbi:MAG TPA: hypothetical protein VGN17_13845 [Bryobacteraceae bacterium]